MYLDFISAKNDYLAASHRAFACGLAAATGGNVSVRIGQGDHMLVKPSGLTLGDVSEQNLIITDLYGQLLEGSIKPTKETLLHGGLYRQIAQIGGIVHVHPIYAMLCANCFHELPAVTKQMKQITQFPVPVLKLKSLTVEEKGMENIYALLQKNADLCCFLLEEHGVVCFAKTARDAENNAELVEENAKVFWEMSMRP